MKDLSVGDIVRIIEWTSSIKTKPKLVNKLAKILRIRPKSRYPIFGTVLDGQYRGQTLYLLYSEVSYVKEEEYPDICEWE